MEPLTFIFIGPSGSGKGTQAKLLHDYLQEKFPGEDILYHEMGKRFREFIKGEGYSNRLSRAVMERGGRQPDFLAVWIWTTVLVNNLGEGTHLVIDGTPRSRNEAHMFETALNFYGRRAQVLFISISREEAIRRMQARGRQDDTLEDMNKRLDWYEEDVSPAVEYYRSSPDYVFHEIDGERPVEEIHKDIVSRISTTE